MSDAYERILKARKKPIPENQRIESTQHHIINLTQQNQRNQSYKPIQSNVKPQKHVLQVNQQVIVNEKKSPPKANRFKPKKKNKNPSKKKAQTKVQNIKINDVLEQDLPNKKYSQVVQIQEEQNINKKSVLSPLESISLSLGHFFNPYSFPLKRQIPIIANFEDQERQKYENGTYISEAFDNNLKTSFLLFVISAIFIPTFMRPSHILWLIAVILSFLIDQEAQYSANRYILVGIYGFYCLFGIIFKFLSVYRRRNWVQKLNQRFSVYNFDQRQRIAQWIQTSPLDLRPGNIFKLSLHTNSVVPTDCIILYSDKPTIRIEESSVLEYLSPLEKQERNVLKQALIKTKEVSLPLTGVIDYELFAPQVRQQHMIGRLVLQQPIQQKYPIGYSNILLRGSNIIGNETNQGKQIICAVLQTGIDSLILKSLQYPYQYRSKYANSQKINKVLLISSIIYILLVVAGILTGYIYTQNDIFQRGSYIQNFSEFAYTDLGKITLHHFTNYIIFIPILLKVIYLITIFLQTKIIENKLGIICRDKQMIDCIQDAGILITTLVSDLPRSSQTRKKQSANIPNIFQQSNEELGRKHQKRRKDHTNHSRKLHSIKLQEIFHNFNQEINEQNYSEEDIEAMGQFMSISLLSCTHSNNKSLSPLEMGISQECLNVFDIKAEVPHPKKNDFLKVAGFKVTQILNFMPTNKYPFKIVFYKYTQQITDIQQENDSNLVDVPQQHQKRMEKILCLIRGEVPVVLDKFYDRPNNYLMFSEKIHQQKGHHVEILCKSVLSYEQFMKIKLAIDGDIFREDQQQYGINSIYGILQQNIKHVQLLGLLIWQNPYLPSDQRPPISSLPHPQYKIVIAPQSRFQNSPQFHSIHTITNYLLKTFKMPVSQLSNKILHQYGTIDEFVSSLLKQRVLVLNGWDYRVIKRMIKQLKEYISQDRNKQIKKQKLLGYIEHDEYAWILKQTDLSIIKQNDGFDLDKYPDLIIKSEGQNVEQVTTVLKKLYLYSVGIKQNINCLILTHFRKSIILATIQFIGTFYTWGTGIPIINSQLYLLLQIILLLDIFYYLLFNIRKYDALTWRAQQHEEKKSRLKKKRNKKQIKSQSIFQKSSIQLETPLQVLFQIAIGIFVGCFLTFVSIYSTTQPLFKQGTVQSQEFTKFIIHFILVHILILPKIFYNPSVISIYKLVIIIIQIALYYVGMIVISQFDTYHMKGIIWYCFSGRVIIVCIFCIWVIISFEWIWFMFKGISRPSMKSGLYQPLKNKDELENQIQDKKV